MHRTTLALSGLAATSLLALAPISPAVAAPATCQGLPATIQQDGGTVTGTEGADVISTTGGVDIRALGGNDTICALGGTVDAGPGNDSVLSTAFSLSGFTVHLGPGDDTFTATSGNNTVDPLPGDSLGKDTITTGNGMDTVSSGVATEPNQDVVHLGDGGTDYLTMLLPAGSSATADGDDPGPSNRGSDILDLLDTGTAPTSWTIALGGGVTRDGVGVADVARFAAYAVDLGASAHVAVTGTSGADVVRLGSGTYDVALGAGDDGVELRDRQQATGRVDAGAGHDSLGASFRERRLDVDLESGRVVSDSTPITARGFEGFSGSAPTVRVTGSDQDDTVRVVGCDVQVRGGEGDDYLSFGDVEDLPDCGRRTPTRFSGGAGADRLFGTNARDVLLGGAGRDDLSGRNGTDLLRGGAGVDKADGGNGKDTCAAEREKACER